MLLSNLISLGFSKTSEALSPGSFLVRGGVVDLFLFNTACAYRVSFLEKKCRVFSITLPNNTIIKELASLRVFSKC